MRGGMVGEGETGAWTFDAAVDDGGAGEGGGWLADDGALRGGHF